MDYYLIQYYITTLTLINIVLHINLHYNLTQGNDFSIGFQVYSQLFIFFFSLFTKEFLV